MLGEREGRGGEGEEKGGVLGEGGRGGIRRVGKRGGGEKREEREEEGGREKGRIIKGERWKIKYGRRV